jgi:hypothetical protein
MGGRLVLPPISFEIPTQPDYGQIAPSEATDARDASRATRMEMRKRIVGTVLSVK